MFQSVIFPRGRGGGGAFPALALLALLARRQALLFEAPFGAQSRRPFP